MSYSNHPVVRRRAAQVPVPTRCEALRDHDQSGRCAAPAVGYAMVDGQRKPRAVCWVHARALDNPDRAHPVGFCRD